MTTKKGLMIGALALLAASLSTVSITTAYAQTVEQEAAVTTMTDGFTFDGAAVQLVKENGEYSHKSSGLRFSISLSKDAYELAKEEDYSVGLLLIPKIVLEGAGRDASYITYENGKLASEASNTDVVKMEMPLSGWTATEKDGEVVSYSDYVYLYNWSPEQFDYEVYAKGYVYGVSEDVIYAEDPRGEGLRSIAYVCNGLIDNAAEYGYDDAMVEFLSGYLPTYTVTFKNGDAVVGSQSVKYGNMVEEPAAPTKDGYVFNGWVDAQGNAFDFEAEIVGATEIYASFKQLTVVESSTPYVVDLYEVADLTQYEIDTAMFGGEAVSAVSINGMDVPVVDGKVDISTVSAGEYMAEFTSNAAGRIVKTPVILATKVLNTAEEILAGLHTYAPNATVVALGNGYYDYDGYFVLGKNIDFTDKDMLSAPHADSVQGAIDNVYTVASNGFRGTFNGMGYSIQNAGFWAGGMFGEVSSGAVIKNTKFENAQVYYAWGARAAILGVNMAAATIENCYFEVACANYPNSNNWTNASSVLAGFTYYGAIIKDTIIVMKENHASLPIMAFEGGTWAGVQGPYLANDFVVVYMTNEGNMVAERDGQTVVRYGTFVDVTEINMATGQVVSVLNSGANGVVKTNDEGVLAVNGTQASGVKPGTAKIWIEFEAGDYTIATPEVEIIVTYAMEVEAPYVVDLYSAGDLTKYELDAMKLGGVAVDSVAINGASIPVVEGKVDISAIPAGEYEAVFTSNSAGCDIKVTVILATKVLNTAEEILAGLHTYAPTATLVNGTFYDYDGYFVLGQSIDFTGKGTISAPHAADVETTLNNVYAVETKGFRGTFNGMGYAIQNASFWCGGMFGEIASGAVIKNTRYENAQVYYAWGATSAILASNMAAATIENCYFEVSCVNYPSSNNWTCGSSVLAAVTYYGAKIKDTTIVMKENAQSLPLVRLEGGSWNGVQGPYLAENVQIIYMTNEGSMVADRDGQNSTRYQ